VGRFAPLGLGRIAFRQVRVVKEYRRRRRTVWLRSERGACCRACSYGQEKPELYWTLNAGSIIPPVSPPTLSARSSPVVLGWGTALPEFSYDQKELAAYLSRDLDRARSRRLGAAFRGSRVTRRYSVLPDFAVGAEPRLFGGAVPPTTAERLDLYEECAPLLGERAARQALEASGVAREKLTHLIFVTCTGLVAPGPDQELIERLGLPLSIHRIQIGFQGCSAGLVGLRSAAEIVRGAPDARILVVSVELSSLHFQNDLGEDDLRGHALFADGSGAAVVGMPGAGGPQGRPLVSLGQGRSLLLPSAKGDMTWNIVATGFRMRLTSRIPIVLSAALPEFVGEFQAGEPAPIKHWAVHPGGPAILDSLAGTLDLPTDSLSASREVLRECGNMSSATIFFVFARIAAAGAPGAGIAFAFGPGLTAEGIAFFLGERS
jgi:alpha-pyrone synthase